MSSAAQGRDARDWWMLDEQAQEDNLARHLFSGDPWGPCSICLHPAFHEIHQERKSRANEPESGAES